MTTPVAINRKVEDYRRTLAAMQEFTQQRMPDTPDELWIVEHPPVYTLGQAGKYEHLLQAHPTIPVIHSDRGGQITYHGPGQCIIYLLLDLRRLGFHVRQLVSVAENAVLNTLHSLNITAQTHPHAPGVYVQEKKIASLGFRIRKGCSYHGLALNVEMELSPFQHINPCGYPGLIMTDVRHELSPDSLGSIENSQHTLMDYCTTHLLSELFCQLHSGVLP